MQPEQTLEENAPATQATETPTPANTPLALPAPFEPSPALQAERDAYLRQAQSEANYWAWRGTKHPEPPPRTPTQVAEAEAKLQSDRAAKAQALAQHLAAPSEPILNPPLPLTPIQERAIPLLIQGLSDPQVARQIGVHRNTVNRWRLFDPVFIARLNRARDAVWANSLDALRSLLPDSVNILAETIRADDHPARLRAAIQLLKIAGTSRLAPRIGPVTTHDVLFDRALRTQRQTCAPGELHLNSPPGNEELDAEMRDAARHIHDPSELTPEDAPQTTKVAAI